MNQSNNPLVSIIIVSYNSKGDLPACLESIFNQGVLYEVFVVDNASTDGSQEVIQEYARRWPGLIKPILNAENMGLAYANNQPLSMCIAKYVLILNPDVVLGEGTLRTMIDYLDIHPDVGIVGPMVFYEDGSRQVSYCHRWTFFDIILWRLIPELFKGPFYDKMVPFKEETVLYVSGCCLMIRHNLFVTLGGYDEHFFLAIEDVADLCLRAKYIGYRTVFYPSAVVVHPAGRSWHGHLFKAMYYSLRGSLYFLKKHKGAVQAYVMLVIILATYVFKAAVTACLVYVFPKRYSGSAELYLSLVKALLHNPF